MAEPTQTQNQISGPRYNPRPLFAILAVVIILAGVIGYTVYRFRIQKPLEADINQINALYVSMTGLSRPIVNRLQDRFGPANADLVANPPTDPSKWIDPNPLIFSYVATEEPERYRDGFKDCCEYLSRKLGRPVEYQIFKSADEKLDAMRDGKLHITAFPTGTVPLAVDAVGFVPVCCLGGEIGAFGERAGDYHVMIIVRPDSSIQKLDDLRGHELGLTDPRSNSGYKAPLVLLSRDHGLLPGRDFSIRYSGGQQTSIAWLANGTFEAAAVASDVLDRAITLKQIGRDQFRVIYTSESFPPACFGYVYNLNPKLAEQIRAALIAFPWEGSGLEKLFAGSNQDRFSPVSYKNDWALVRQIDDAIGAAHTIK